MTAAVALTTIIAVLPGFSSLFALALLLPFAFQLEPAAEFGRLRQASVPPWWGQSSARASLRLLCRSCVH